MDGLELTITATINIITVVGMVYYMKGYMKAKFGAIDQKLKSIEENQKQNTNTLYKYIDTRISDLKEYVKTQFNTLYKMFNTRVRNIEEIVYREE